MSQPRIRSVELNGGIEVYSSRDRTGEPLKWRVRFPRWCPTGSWLHGSHYWFDTLDEALSALNKTGFLDAADTLWEANLAKERARQEFMSRAMAAYGKATHR